MENCHLAILDAPQKAGAVEQKDDRMGWRWGRGKIRRVGRHGVGIRNKSVTNI